MAKRPGVYLFEAGVHEDILANDGKLAVDEFLSARRILNSSSYPLHYEEDLVQEERRKHFVLKDWALVSLIMDDKGNITKALIVNLEHHDEGYLVDLRYASIKVAFYRGFDIREFPDMPVQDGKDFLSSIGIEEEEYAVSSDYSLEEDDEEAPIIEVEKPRFVANSKKKIVNFGGAEIKEEPEERIEEDDEDLRIEVARPNFEAGKKKQIANLGQSFSSIDIDDDEEVNISVTRPSFVANNSKKPRNLNATPDWVRKKKDEVEAPAHIEVEKPSFVASKKGKIRNIVDVKPDAERKIERVTAPKGETPAKPSFQPIGQGKPSNIVMKEEAKPEVQEERNLVYTDIFKLKPRVFQGERAILHDPKAKGDEKYFEMAKEYLAPLTEIRISKNCVFVPEVMAEDDHHLDLLKSFKLEQWDLLALTLNKDEKVIYAFLAHKEETDYAILVSFKHKGAHIVVVSTRGGAIDDRALPYYSYKELREIVFAS